MSTTDPVAHDSGPSAPIPPWADVFLDAAIAASFVAVVTDVVEQRWGTDAQFDRALGQVTLADGRLINFANAACELIGFDEPYWRRYLFSMLSDFESFDAAGLQAELRSWSRIRSRLRVRLFPTGGLDPLDHPALMARPIGDSMSLIIAADTDAGCVPISVDISADWNRPDEQAWRCAIKNSRTRGRHDVSSVRTFDTSFLMVEGDLFTTGLARDLTSLLWRHSADGAPRLGALVSAPTSRSLFVQPIDDLPMVATYSAGLITASIQYQAREPGAMGCNLFWYRGVDDLVSAVEFDPGSGVRVVAPEPLARWLL